MNRQIDFSKYPEYVKSYKTHLNQLKFDESATHSISSNFENFSIFKFNTYSQN